MYFCLNISVTHRTLQNTKRLYDIDKIPGFSLIALMPKTHVSRSDFLFLVRFAIDYVKNKVLPGAIERFQKERNNKVGKSPVPPRFFRTISDYKYWETISMQTLHTRTRFSGSAEHVLELE